MTCQYFGSDFELCGEPAVHVSCRMSLCARHKRASTFTARRNMDAYRFKRATERGVVSQCEMLDRLEHALEAGMQRWQWDAGAAFDTDESMTKKPKSVDVDDVSRVSELLGGAPKAAYELLIAYNGDVKACCQSIEDALINQRSRRRDGEG